MALTNAQKQARYRERALRDPDGLLLTRLQVMISAQAAAGLERICTATGKTRKLAVEDAIIALEKSILPER